MRWGGYNAYLDGMDMADCLCVRWDFFCHGGLEIRYPGGQGRRGILGLTTTRGDRLFISLLGSAYIFLAWLGLVGTPLWWPLGLSICGSAFCFWKV